MIREPELRDLVEAVSAPTSGFRRITEANDDGGPCGLDEVLADGSAFFVQIPNLSLIALDLDPDKFPGCVERASEALRALEIPAESVVRQASGRSGPAGIHQHWWINGGWPSNAAALGDDLKTLLPGEVVHYARAMRPPGTPHRHGLPVQLLEPATVGEALARLHTPTSMAQGPLPDEIWALVGVPGTSRWLRSDGKPHRRNHTFRVACKFKARGYPYAYFHGLAQTASFGEKYREVRASRGQSAAELWLEEVWALAYDKLGSDAVREAIRAARAAVDMSSWDRRTLKTTVKVMEVLFGCAERLGSTVFDLDVRTISEQAPAGNVAVRRALGRLCGEYGVFVRLLRGTGATASKYRIRESKSVDRPIHVSAPPVASRYVSMYVTHDLFGPKPGLRTEAAWVYGLLTEQPQTVESIAAQHPALTVRSVRASLNRLHAVALSTKHPGRVPTWTKVQATDHELDAIAEALGAHGKSAKVKSRHADERTRQKRFLNGEILTDEQKLTKALANHGLQQVASPPSQTPTMRTGGAAAGAHRNEPASL